MRTSQNFWCSLIFHTSLRVGCPSILFVQPLETQTLNRRLICNTFPLDTQEFPCGGFGRQRSPTPSLQPNDDHRHLTNDQDDSLRPHQFHSLFGLQSSVAYHPFALTFAIMVRSYTHSLHKTGTLKFFALLSSILRRRCTYVHIQFFSLVVDGEATQH